MEFWYGVVFTLLIESVVLIYATDWLRKEKQNAEEDTLHD